MKPLLITLLLSLSIIGCRPNDKKQPVFVKPVADTAFVNTVSRKVEAKYQSFLANEKILLMQYYAAGWMDVSNKMIELHNTGRFNNYQIEKARKQYWAKMRLELNSK